MTQASVRLTERLATMATAKTDCAAVTKSSTRWVVSSGRPWRTPANIEKTMGRVPTRSVHWLTLDEMRAPRPVRLANLQANRVATSNSGASEAVGAIHLTRRNSLTPIASPSSMIDSANASAQSRITPAATTNMA